MSPLMATGRNAPSATSRSASSCSIVQLAGMVAPRRQLLHPPVHEVAGRAHLQQVDPPAVAHVAHVAEDGGQQRLEVTRPPPGARGRRTPACPRRPARRTGSTSDWPSNSASAGGSMSIRSRMVGSTSTRRAFWSLTSPSPELLAGALDQHRHPVDLLHVVLVRRRGPRPRPGTPCRGRPRPRSWRPPACPPSSKLVEQATQQQVGEPDLEQVALQHPSHEGRRLGPRLLPGRHPADGRVVRRAAWA